MRVLLKINGFNYVLKVILFLSIEIQINKTIFRTFSIIRQHIKIVRELYI